MIEVTLCGCDWDRKPGRLQWWLFYLGPHKSYESWVLWSVGKVDIEMTQISEGQAFFAAAFALYILAVKYCCRSKWIQYEIQYEIRKRYQDWRLNFTATWQTACEDSGCSLPAFVLLKVTLASHGFRWNDRSLHHCRLIHQTAWLLAFVWFPILSIFFYFVCY